MHRADNPRQVGVLGAGTMGRGIAQVAITHAWGVVLHDADPAAAREAADAISARLERGVAKGRLSSAQRDEALARLRIARRADEAAGSALIIEAVPEDPRLKATVLAPFADGAGVLATNTSSLSVLGIGESIGAPGRVIGMHFFNPAPVQRLVEVVATPLSDESAVRFCAQAARDWGKTVVHSSDSPGFIVNRVARPYYLEPWRLLAEGVAGAADIDRATRENGGFPMGPFELLDFIGHDLSAAVSRAVWDRLGRPERLAPPPAQQAMVERGDLGRKSGRGAYSYSGGRDPEPLLAPGTPGPPPSAATTHAVDRFASRATDTPGEQFAARYVLARVLLAYILEGAWALHDSVADERDIDTAMKLGIRFPLGPLEWARRIGHDVCRGLIDCLRAEPGGERFAAPGSMFGRADGA